MKAVINFLRWGAPPPHTPLAGAAPNIKILFRCGVDFTSRNWLSPIQTYIRAISQKIQIFTVSIG